ncbi:hypothetical protein, partial [Burkholderia cenocepacia]|uniref:hypothetical protein n=1 Tax=Burkholderia cenocepacia TaxID=95486 RepID=UPI001C890860
SNIRLSERIFLNAVTDLLARTVNFPTDYILFPVGQDFFHVDNSQNRTVNDTLQDLDTRYAKMIETGTLDMIHAIDMLISRARV